MHKLILILLVFVGLVALIFYPPFTSQLFQKTVEITNNTVVPTPARQSPKPSPVATPYPSQTARTLNSSYHVFQTFNNCGPAALSMALFYYGVNETQQVLGQALRPYQNPQGDNDDKSVTLPELGEKAKDYDLVSFHRPNGNRELIKRAISAGFPVITRTWLKANEDIGHYRVIKGFDDAAKTIIQDDSLQGKNLVYSYEEFAEIWEKFNYEFLLLIPKDKIALAQGILMENFDENASWNLASDRAERLLTQNPNDIYARFNYSVALFHTGDYEQSVTEFEKVERELPFRTLWYQIEPIEAYYELKQYDRVLQMTQKILDNQNRAFSELYIIRGNIYTKRGNTTAAKAEYDKALLYNKNLKAAQSTALQ